MPRSGIEAAAFALEDATRNSSEAAITDAVLGRLADAPSPARAR
jgi:hypothetical protein